MSSDPPLRDALDPPRAHGEPLGNGRLKLTPEDFQVEEDLGFAPSGAGQHVLLRVRKCDANTAWVARKLARLARCPIGAVGYAGMKDRRAISVQWFSVPRSALQNADWLAVQDANFAVLEAHEHHRKLPRGALAGNRFLIRIRGLAPDARKLEQRAALIRQRGVPNYFGPQRFGREGANLRCLPAQVTKLPAGQRSFVLSAARSWIFNRVLAERVRAGNWDRLQAGDLANLEGRGSFFAVHEPDPDLEERLAALQIHPTGPLWGRGAPPSGGAVRALEEHLAAGLPEAASLVAAAGMDQERRALRLIVQELQLHAEAEVITLRFRLGRGAYATSILRELFELDQGSDSST